MKAGKCGLDGGGRPPWSYLWRGVLSSLCVFLLLAATRGRRLSSAMPSHCLATDIKEMGPVDHGLESLNYGT